jgi:hypothetical protein
MNPKNVTMLFRAWWIAVTMVAGVWLVQPEPPAEESAPMKIVTPVNVMDTPEHTPQDFQLKLRYVDTIKWKCTGYTRFDDLKPGEDPWKATYASVNFLPGSKRPDLFDPDKPFRRTHIKVREIHWTVAPPVEHAKLFEERVQEEKYGAHWYHRYRLFVHGYNKAGTLSVPRDRCPNDSFDCFFSGWTKEVAQARAFDFSNETRKIEIYRLDWVPIEDDLPSFPIPERAVGK